MASNNLRSTPYPSSMDTLLIQSLMSRLQLRPPAPYLDPNSLLSLGLDDYLLPNPNSSDDDDDDEEDESSALAGDEEAQRRLLAKEEAKLEKEIIRIVHSSNAEETLKANSGHSVSIGDHNICVGVHDEPQGQYRVWEWHGHIMLFDEEDGYRAEYIYGNYFERIPENRRGKREVVVVEEDEEEERRVVVGNEVSGLRDLIGEDKDLGGRVVHRNSLSAGSAPAAK